MVAWQFNITVPANPFVPTTLIVPVPDVPCVTAIEVVPPEPGPNGGVVTVNAIVVFALSEPEVPVMVTVAGLEVTAAEVLAVRVST